jgi:hypothetical protein
VLLGKLVYAEGNQHFRKIAVVYLAREKRSSRTTRSDSADSLNVDVVATWYCDTRADHLRISYALCRKDFASSWKQQDIRLCGKFISF